MHEKRSQDMGLRINPNQAAQTQNVKKKPLEELSAAAQQIKAGDYTRIGTLIGDSLRTGQVHAPSNMATGW